MIPLLHPLAEVSRRYRPVHYKEDEAPLSQEEAQNYLGPENNTEKWLWWELNNRAAALYLTDRAKEALPLVERAISMRRTKLTLVNMALILEALGRFEEAFPYAAEVYNAFPDDENVVGLYGEALLRFGQFSRGWPLYVQSRANMDWAKMFLPEWEGPHQDLKGKRLLVIEGGGYGENIYFLRWLDTLKSWGADIHYICQPSLAPLVHNCGFTPLENWNGNIDIRWERYDYYVPLLALAHKLGVTIQNYSWTGPYIRRRGFKIPHRWRAGICWRAGEGKSPRKHKSLSETQLRRVLSTLHPRYWVNLTLDKRAGMISPKLENWQDTTNVLSSLDLLITVDTGVAHLGGAMGIPTWVLLSGAGSWHYPLGYFHNPLYPSMKVFRNNDEGLDNSVDTCVAELKLL